MKRISMLTRVSTVVLGGALAMAPSLQARTCSGNGDVVGSFGWIATRDSAFVPAASTPPGTTIAGSSTLVGGLVTGAANTAAFASVGRVAFDGNGGVFASSTPGGPIAQVGTYTVNGDCTISTSLTDAFALPGGAGLTPVQANATFEGVVVQGGGEVDLMQTGSIGGTILTLRKTRQYCSTDGLASAFGISATGVSTSTVLNVNNNGTASSSTPTTTPFSLVGRFVADGAGNLVEDNIAFASPLTNREVTGTYTVNVDCTGTATLVTADGKKRGANIVVVTQGSNLTNGPQMLEFAFTDSGVVGSGLAQQQ
jgi:hypothetical protein